MVVQTDTATRPSIPAEALAVPGTRVAVRPDLAWRTLLVLAAAKLLLHLLTNSRYGYFIDELYYLACSEHLGLGYVDQPPVIGWMTWIVRGVLGDSLPALRFLPAVFGAATVFAAGGLVRELGGRRFAQALGALAVVASPLYLFMNTILSMNALDALLWTAALWIVARIARLDPRAPDAHSTRLWLGLGLVAGIGLENKLSFLFFGFAILAAMLATPQRRWLRSRGPWLAAAVAILLFLPHIVWQVQYGFPTLEFVHNAATLKNRELAPHAFVATQALEAHPFGFVLVLLGLGHFFFARAGRPYRLFGWFYLAFLAVLLLRNGKPYYAGPVYPTMFAGGAVLVERWFAGRTWPRIATLVLFVLGGALLAPMTLPVLPPPVFIAYQQALLGGTLPSSEDKEVGPLPQHFADMFGWEELAAATARAYAALSPEERAVCGIYGMSYGQAGAIDALGPRYGLPKAVSGHNSYWTWGTRGYTGEVMLVLGLDAEILGRHFDSVELAATVDHPYAMPWRNPLPIWLCRGFRHDFAGFWPEMRHYE